MTPAKPVSFAGVVLMVVYVKAVESTLPTYSIERALEPSGECVENVQGL